MRGSSRDDIRIDGGGYRLEKASDRLDLAIAIILCRCQIALRPNGRDYAAQRVIEGIAGIAAGIDHLDAPAERIILILGHRVFGIGFADQPTTGIIVPAGIIVQRVIAPDPIA